jgi:hypothetical protein
MEGDEEEIRNIFLKAPIFLYSPLVFASLGVLLLLLLIYIAAMALSLIILYVRIVSTEINGSIGT